MTQITVRNVEQELHQLLGELWGGFAVGSRNQENREELDTFLRSQRVKVVPIISDTAERYAFIFYSFSKPRISAL